MSEPQDPLAESRQARDSAKSTLTGHFAGLKTGLQTRPISRRLTDEALNRAKSVADEAKEIALENKGVISATLAALVAWFLRKPIQRGYERALPEVTSGASRLWGKIRARFGKGHGEEEANDE